MRLRQERVAVLKHWHVKMDRGCPRPGPRADLIPERVLHLTSKAVNASLGKFDTVLRTTVTDFYAPRVSMLFEIQHTSFQTGEDS